jgi:NAD(P)-dependent dehydrogenase (short-subunit alcohol dehydrogenase family)
LDLTGKVALVTGAAQGIGKAVAMLLAQRGADIIVSDINLEKAEETSKEIATLGPRAMAIRANVAVVEEVEKMVQAIIERFGQIHILVNNAGIARDKLLLRMTEEDWDRVFAVNVKGHFNFAQVVGRQMVTQGHGKIINMSSCSGKKASAEEGAYCASKAAILGLNRVLALEWGKHNICVNALAPTFVETPMTRPMLEEKSFRDYVMGNIVLGRLCKPEDLTGGLIFLASDASDMVTGHILHIDGGWTAH